MLKHSEMLIKYFREKQRATEKENGKKLTQILFLEKINLFVNWKLEIKRAGSFQKLIGVIPIFEFKNTKLIRISNTLKFD